MKKVLLFIFFFLAGLVSLAQAPPNDNCSTATNLGTLPTPAACPTATGASVTSVGTNINATSPAVYTTLLGCQTGGNQPGPALDVWYTFVATGNMIVVNITPGVAPALPNPAITLWTGSCGSLVGMNCANNGSAGGVITATFQPTTPGTTYYLQVSGSTPTAAGNFNLSVSNNNDCNNCNTNSNLTYTPAPVGGTYPANTTVNFCYQVTTFNQVSANWLHGVTPTFGCGWDLTTIVPTPPPSCAGTGTWGWYNSNTSSANLTTLGPGFYYETASGASCACVNANPGDNFGDVGAVGCTWTFCWSIKTKATCGCPNLNISLNTTGDGESGSWTSVACTGDPDYHFASSMNCCLVTATTTSVSCFGGTNGSATANPTGTAPFTYTWNSVPVQNTQTATNLPAGTYTVTVKDNVGCISTTTVVIAQPAIITVPITFVPATCASLNGSATANPTGGVGPYTYTWSTVPVQNTQTATGLGAGTFTCTVKDSHGCIKTGTVTVTSTGSITATATTTNISCFGGSDGSATANPVGTAPYTYTWSSIPVQNTQIATNLPVGVYTCTIKDGSGCMTTVTVSITQPPLLTVAIASTTNVTCFGGNNGAVNITVGGGTPAYTYAWNSVPVQNTQNATSLPAGSYTVTVKDSKGCIATTSVVITQPPTLTTSASNTGPYCAGSTISLTTPASTSYTWTGPSAFNSNVQSPTIANATAAMAGTYSVLVSAGTCTAFATTNVVVNPLPTPVANNTGPYCPGNTIQLNVGAFTTYTWSGPSAFSSNAQNPTIAGATPAMSGVYTVSVTNAQGCVNSTTTNVVVNPTPVVVIGSNSPVCLNAVINLTSSGGTTYSWSGPNAFSSTLQNPTINPATAVNAGVYTVTVTSLGCTNTGTVSVTVLSPTTSASNTGPYCAGQTISLSTPAATSYTWTGPSAFSSNAQSPTIANATAAMAGTYSVLVSAGTCTAVATTVVIVNALPTPAASNTGPYCPGNTIQLNVGAFTTYTWSGPSAFSSNVQNATVTNAQTTNSGNYTVTVSNAAGCTNTAVTNVVVNPTPVVVIGSNSPVCLNNTINLNSGGGTTYSWSGPNAFTSTLQNPTISPAAPVNAGVYTVTVTSLGCTNTGTVSVTVLSPTTSASNTGPYCAGQTISLSTPAATSYTWTGPSAFSSNAQSPTIANAAVGMAGTYSVLVSAGACTAFATTNVIVNALPIPIANSNSPICFGQTLNLTGTGGTTYTWTGPAFNSNLQNPSITNATTANSGNYVLTVTDANGCKNTANVNVVVNPLPVIAVNNPTNCVNTTINLTSNGGVTYSWSGPNTFTSNAQNPSIPAAQLNMSGAYTVTVTSAQGCTNTAVANVTVLPLPTPNITSNSPVCAGKTLNLFGTGGATYSWSGPGYSGPTQNPTINNVTAAANGVYTLLVSSGTCTASTTYTVVINPVPVFNFSGSNVLCNGQSNGTSTVNVTVGTGPYTYQWSSVPAQSTQNATALPAGTYSCIVTDANGCTSVASTNITQPTQFSVAISSTTLSACAGSPINVNGFASGGTFPYTYNWIGGPATGAYSITEPLSGSYIYTLNASDANSCTAIANINLTYFPQPTVTATSATLCAGQTANLVASGAQTYIWQPGNITGSTYPYSGNTSVNVSVIGTANGCSNSANTNIMVYPNPNANISASTANGCVPTCITFTGAATTSVTSYNWTLNGAGITGAQTGQYCFSEGATYSLGLSVIDNNGCTGAAPPFAVNIYPAPIADFNHSPIKPIVNIDQEVTFTDASYNTPIVSWNWYFMNTAQYTSTQQNPIFSYTEPGTYVVALVVKSDKGCYDTLLRPIVVGEDFGIYVPNAFTPNGDGLNDVFQPKGFGVTKYELNIFDRWGEKMFHTTTFEEGWNGTKQAHHDVTYDIKIEEGVYTWLIDCTDVFGKAHELKGHVTLIK
jgi:gliding motility-associated-like protein